VNLGLTDEQRGVREVFAAFFEKEATPERVRAAEPVGHDPAMWTRIIETGVLGIAVPEPLGGGAGLLEAALVAEEAGRRVAPVPIAEPIAAALLLAECDSQDLLTEALDGTSLVSLTTSYTPVYDELLPDGAVADVVLALDGDQIVAFSRPDGCRHLPNMGALPLARWTTPPVRAVVAKGHAVERFERARDAARVLRAAALVGLAHEAIEIGAAYARERRAFGVPIGTYQAVAHPLADAVVAADGAQLLVWKACWALTSGHADGPALASMAIVFAGQTAYQAAQHSLHIHGGYGFMAEYDIQLYYRRAKAWLTAITDPSRELAVLADRRYGAVQAATAPGEGSA
jgi:alkylation response protein AidB-like acyl-CoA dehydrogenase